MISVTRFVRPSLVIGATLLVAALLLLSLHEPFRQRALLTVDFTAPRPPSPSTTPESTAQQPHSLATLHPKLHLLLPASNGNVDLCKTILTGAILGYPTPTVIAWNQTFDRGNLLGGGSHLAKIEKVLQYLDSMDPSTDEDLILMVDAYDIWFQLRPEVLLSRYHAINAEADKRLASRLGKAVQAEGLRQTIIFGAGKRCAPNQMHTIACYPIPDSPLPDDLYGKNTDTVMGRNKYTSLKQRYLNSGYVIGPAAEMRLLYRRAREKVQAAQDQDEWDNGSHGSDFMYHGSDQSIFNTILGEQEYQREVMRRRHLSWIDRLRGHSKPKSSHIEGTIITDPLHPSFVHEPFVAMKDRSNEFGIGLDYFSQLGHQTINTEEDVHYLRFNESIPEQLKDRHGLFDCASRVDGVVSQDILDSRVPFEALAAAIPDWTETPLFTNLCLNQVPVMIHHNGDKGARAWQWPLTWMQGAARKLLEQIQSSNSLPGDQEGEATGGVFLPNGDHLSWDQLCPVEYEWELYRDVEKPGK